MKHGETRSLAASLLAKLDEREDSGERLRREFAASGRGQQHDSAPTIFSFQEGDDDGYSYRPFSTNGNEYNVVTDRPQVALEEDDSFLSFSSPTPIRHAAHIQPFKLHREGAKYIAPFASTARVANGRALLPAKDDMTFGSTSSQKPDTDAGAEPGPKMVVRHIPSDPYGDSVWENSGYLEMNTTVADNALDAVQDDEPVVTLEELKRREDEKGSTNKLGVKIVPVTRLPDKWRSTFRFGCFNSVQSKVFHAVYETDENLVVSAPTGSGKTTIFELAFIRMMKEKSSTYASDPLAIYLAPTKALCNERARDWDERLSAVGISCIEVTGDTGHTAAAINALKEAHLIVTTPEKWDSLTRRASAISKVMNRLALIMIDEVHILREARGATLEVVISRMKSRGDRVRFVALSASVPNIEDVARWLAPNDSGSVTTLVMSETHKNGEPTPKAIARTATVFKFGEEFRPTQLQREVYGFDLVNEWATHAELDKHLYRILLDHSKGQPVLVFCSTRRSCQTTAETVFQAYKEGRERGAKLPWKLKNQKPLQLKDSKIAELTALGIAVHHAGLEYSDRREIEEAFRQGQLYMIVSTSTLAVGVNLPAHTVIIKGTTTWRGIEDGHCEYSDIDIQQMMGRAGRPQYDTSGLLIVMCERHQVKKYRDMLDSKTVLESTLHENLIEHINSEIGLKTITSTKEAQEWLKSSFLYIRIQRNPKHYAFAALRDKRDEKAWEEWLDHHVENALASLHESEFIRHVEGETLDGELLEHTPYGTVMSNCFISYGTMCSIMAMQADWGSREMLEVMAGASEFAGLRIRAGESQMLNKLRQGSELRFSLSEAVKTYADKVFLYLQVCLANIDLDKYTTKGDSANNSTSSIILSIWRQAPRLAKAICHVALHKGYGSAIRASLELLHAISGKAWDDSSTIFRQLDNIGPKSLKVLEKNNLHTFSDLIRLEPMRLETWLNRLSPFGQRVIDHAKAMPRYDLNLIGQTKESQGRYPEVLVEVTIKSLGGVTKVVNRKHKSFNINYNLSVLVYRSDGKLIDFRRMEARKLKPEHCKYTLSTPLDSPEQYILVYGGVDEVAGCASSATLKPELSKSRFPIDCDIESLQSDDDEPNAVRSASSAASIVSVKNHNGTARKKSKKMDLERTRNDVGASNLLSQNSDETSRAQQCAVPGETAPPRASKGISPTQKQKRSLSMSDDVEALPKKTRAVDGDSLMENDPLNYSDDLEALLRGDDIMKFVAPPTKPQPPLLQDRPQFQGGPPVFSATPFVPPNIFDKSCGPSGRPSDIVLPGMNQSCTEIAGEVDELDSEDDDSFSSFMKGLTGGAPPR